MPKQKGKKELTSKESIYQQIGDMVKEKTGKRIGRTGGRAIFDFVVKRVFQTATEEGSFRFNGGFGSLHVREYQPGSRRLPSGQEVEFGERKKLRYEEGVVVKAMVAGEYQEEEPPKNKEAEDDEEEAEDDEEEEEEGEEIDLD